VNGTTICFRPLLRLAISTPESANIVVYIIGGSVACDIFALHHPELSDIVGTPHDSKRFRTQRTLRLKSKKTSSPLPRSCGGKSAFRHIQRASGHFWLPRILTTFPNAFRSSPFHSVQEATCLQRSGGHLLAALRRVTQRPFLGNSSIEDVSRAPSFIEGTSPQTAFEGPQRASKARQNIFFRSGFVQ
jgi:hypothetical protein